MRRPDVLGFLGAMQPSTSIWHHAAGLDPILLALPSQS